MLDYSIDERKNSPCKDNTFYQTAFIFLDIFLNFLAIFFLLPPFFNISRVFLRISVKNTILLSPF